MDQQPFKSSEENSFLRSGQRACPAVRGPVTFFGIEEYNIAVRFFGISEVTDPVVDDDATIKASTEVSDSQQPVQEQPYVEPDEHFDVPIPKPETLLAISRPTSNFETEQVSEQESKTSPVSTLSAPEKIQTESDPESNSDELKESTQDSSIETAEVKPRVLIIDDDTIVSTMLKHLLELRGYETDIAADGRRAIELIDSLHPPSLVLLDVMLPFVNGFELLYKIENKHGWEDVPVLMLSAKTREDDIVRALETGADDYIIKPFQPQELIARINRLNSQD